MFLTFNFSHGIVGLDVVHIHTVQCAYVWPIETSVSEGKSTAMTQFFPKANRQRTTNIIPSVYSRSLALSALSSCQSVACSKHIAHRDLSVGIYKNVIKRATQT